MRTPVVVVPAVATAAAALVAAAAAATTHGPPIPGDGGVGGTLGVAAGGGGGAAANGYGGDGGDAGSTGSDSTGSAPVGPGGAAGSGSNTGTGGGTSTYNADSSGAGGGGGGLYGTSDLSTLFSGSGGGGGGGQKNGAGAAGGDGGGIIYIIADSVSNSGSISARGTAGGTGGDDPAAYGAGGGGSGGSILIEATSWTSGGTLTVAGGGGGAIGGGTYPGPAEATVVLAAPISSPVAGMVPAGSIAKNLPLMPVWWMRIMTDFPVLISFTGDSDLAAGAQSDFDDVLFTSANGTTRLDHEIEDFDSTNGDIVAWVKIPFLSSSSDTDIYMYYGCGTAENQENPPEVWSNGFTGVWHLHDDFNDSTSEGNNGTNSGSANDTGKMADGQYFDSSDDISTGTNSTMANATEVTITAWIKPDAGQSDWGGILEYRDSDVGWETVLEVKSTRKFSFGTWTDTDSWYNLESTAVLPTTGFSHIVGVYNGSNQITYLDGQLDNTSPGRTGNLRNNSRPFHIGRNPGDLVTFNGVIDEVRIANIARSLEWISTEHNNHDNPGIGAGKFIKSVGDEEEPVVFANLYEGTAQILSTGYITTVDITDVDLSKSFLVFSAAVNDTESQCSQVTGRLYDDSGNIKVQFERYESSGCEAIDIRYYVAEFSSGVSVQRGYKTTLTATTTDVTLSPTVNTSKSFPLISGFVNGTTHDGNDFIEAEITASNNLQLRRNTGTGTAKVSWQVVEFSDCAVQSGTISSWTTASTTDSLSPTVDLDKSWLIYSYKTSTGDDSNMAENMVRGRITANNELTFDRDDTGSTIESDLVSGRIYK